MIEKGKLLAGRYRLIEQIDSGGTAYIFRAKDEMTDETVAVKVLKPELTDNQEFVLRFKKEVQASLKLRHANIIRAYDAGLDDGMYYIVMELIQGKTLKHLININGPLPLKYIVSIAKKICLALEYAHVKGFIHRDIKPHNVMIDMTGEPYIADFGIAKNLSQNTLTIEEDSVMGSVHYFSPEQARGERADKRSDLYSLGIMLYEMLTGTVPFDADTSVAIALKHINDPMPDPADEVRDVPQSIIKIIMKATQKDKHFRYKSAFTMYEDLQRCLTEPDGEYIKYTESKRTQQHMEETHHKRTRRNLVTVFLSIGIGVAAVAVIINIISGYLDQSIVKHTSVPEVEGMEADNAVARLEAEDLKVDLAYEYSSQPEGVVISQQPEVGETVELGSTVDLAVSKGFGAEVMPNVTDMPLERAQEVLSESGIEVTSILKSTEGEMTIGNVIEQNPVAGQPITEGENVYLRIKVSPDEYKMLMPDVLGNSIGEALQKLKEAEFRTYFLYEEESKIVPDTIIQQEPEKDTEYLLTSPVKLYIPKTEGTTYEYSGVINVEIPEDKTRITIAIASEIDGIPVYYVIDEKVETAGDIEKQLEITMDFDESGDTVEKQLVVFLNDSISITEPVTFKKAGSE